MRIVYPTASVTVEVPLSQPLTLECVVSGSPAPAAKWFQNGKEVTPGPLHRQRHNNLAFVAVTRSDEGSYNCATETEQGTVISPNYTVNVLGKTKTRKAVAWGPLQPMAAVRLTSRPLLHRACVGGEGPERPACPSWLLCAFHLRSERKPLPEHHMAVQRRPHRAIAPLSDLRIVARYLRRDSAGCGRVPVSPGQRDRLGTVARNAYNTIR